MDIPGNLLLKPHKLLCLTRSVKIQQSGLQGDEAGVISSVYGADFPVRLGRVDASKPDPSKVPKPGAPVADIQVPSQLLGAGWQHRLQLLSIQLYLTGPQSHLDASGDGSALPCDTACRIKQGFVRHYGCSLLWAHVLTSAFLCPQKFMSALNNPNKTAPSGPFAIFQAKPLFWERPAFLLWTAAQVVICLQLSMPYACTLTGLMLHR